MVDKTLNKFKKFSKKRNHSITSENPLKKEKINNSSISDRSSFSTVKGSTVKESSFE